MTTSPRLIAAGVAALAVFSVSGSSLARTQTATSEAKPIRLADSTLIVEVNATDGDAGLQVFLDGEPWRSMRITGPTGRAILAVDTVGRLVGYGLTELFSESSEPSFDVFPLEKFEALFPEGRYTFAGETIDGKKITGAARLSHDFPAGPQIVSPADGAVLGRRAVVARWRSVPEPAGIDIVGYRAIVTREDPLRILGVDLPARARKATIPPEFLERRTEYKLEVQAIEKSGNQTLTEVTFRVG
jgi:hypothetical protein